MARKPEVSVAIGLGMAVIVFELFRHAVPSQADMRSVEPRNKDIQAAERTATWIGAGLVTGVSLLLRDETVFAIGGATVVALAVWTRHSDEVNPMTGKALSTSGGMDKQIPAQTQAQNPAAYEGYDTTIM